MPMRPFFAYRQESLFIPVFVQGAIISLVCLSVCLYLYVCVTFVVFTDCESCARANCTDSDSIERASMS